MSLKRMCLKLSDTIVWETSGISYIHLRLGYLVDALYKMAYNKYICHKKYIQYIACNQTEPS